MDYINENLAPGHWGYFFIVLAFGAALLSFVSYLIGSTGKQDRGWWRIGRVAYMLHGVGVLGIFGVLFYLIYTHQFQYHYVYAHSSMSLPVEYMISSFWEGQEGSFLLWAFWHVVLGIVAICTTRKWEAPVMAVIALTQVMLVSMLLGLTEISILGTTFNVGKIGSNPFILLRDVFPEDELFRLADYRSFIEDGRGLNVLLQNYWMVIHPPVLFLGFASTVVPFAFAIGGLFTRRFTEWVRPALPWMIFGAGALGLGILMGGAWAYEALSFGGFWAWDPVENASLVPWLIMVAGMHTMLIFHARKRALMASFLFVCLTFILILYSTFLTRSGILGDSSVHSFTDLGLSGQLLLFLFLFIVVSAVLMIVHWKRIPRSEGEESIWSREFWMFMGSLVLSLSALHIIAITSIEVVNKINKALNSWLGSGLPENLTKPADVITAYHQLQIPFAIVILALTAIAQYMRYIKTPARPFWRQTLFSVAAAAVLAALIAWGTGLGQVGYILLLFAAMYSLAVNAVVLAEPFRHNRYKVQGSTVGHIGFAILIAGALIANAQKRVISLNTEGFETLSGAPEKEQFENKTLFEGMPVRMQDYRITYLGDSIHGQHVYFRVQYERLDTARDKVKERFALYPYVVYNPAKDEMSAPSPDTRHYLHKDIFTHITSASKTRPGHEQALSFDTTYAVDLKTRQPQIVEGVTVTLDSLGSFQSPDAGQGSPAIKAIMFLTLEKEGESRQVEPSFIITGNQLIPEPVDVKEWGLRLLFTHINPTEGIHRLVIMSGKPQEPKFITLKAVVFPWINLLWLGSVIMVIGFVLSGIQRIRQNRTHATKS